MNERIRKIFTLISAPLILFIIYISLFFIWKLTGFPQGDELLAVLRGYFGRYGLWIVFIAALAEGFLIVGQYFPGGTVIFLGVISVGHDMPRVIEVVAVVSLAFIISYTLNYLVGKYGWYRLFLKFGLRNVIERSKEKLIRRGLHAVMFSYWEPNLASVAATAAGIIQAPFRKFFFYNVVDVVFWDAFWGTIIVLLGQKALKFMGLKYVVIIISVWTLIIFAKNHFSKNKKLQKSFFGIASKW